MKGMHTHRGETLTLGNSASLLSYDKTFKVVICTEHGYAIQNINRHLKDYHGGQASIRKAVVASFSNHELVTPKDLQPPAPLGRPHPLLQRPVKAYHCVEEECDFLTCNRDVIRKHCAGEHDFHPTRRDPMHWTTVWVQTFFIAGKQNYFSVLPDEDELTPSTTEPATGVEVGLIKDGWLQQVEKHRRELETADAEVSKQDHTGWFNRTGWPTHLSGANLRHLAKASRLPLRGEADLLQAAVLVERLIERCVTGLGTLHHESRRWLKSAKTDDPQKRPMARLQNRESQVKYAGYLKRFVCYSLRIAARILSKQDAATDPVDGGDDDSDDTDGDTGEEGGDDCGEGPDERQTVRGQSDPLYDAERLFPWKDDQLRLASHLLDSLRPGSEERVQMEALLQYCKAFIFQRIWGSPFESGLVHFVAILGIDDDQIRLREAHNFSYMLAGLVYDVRVLAAEILLPMDARSDQGEAAVQRFLEQRRTFLVDGCYAPMSQMLSLLAYGKHLSLNHGNAGMIDWTDEETMMLRGQRLCMSRFKCMVADAITEAEDLMWAGLMWCRQADRFDIDLDLVEDDVTFAKRGYSFVDRAGNGLDGGLDWMLARMMATAKGRELRRDMHWRKHSVRAYLKAVERFKRLLLFVVHVTGGQPARGPEVLGLRFRNGFLQDRNIFVISGQVVAVTRYHKSQSQWDVPKVIPRFLPWRVGQLLSVYICYLRPFVELLSVDAIGLCWTDHLWSGAGGCWETDKLSGIIADQTARKLGVRLTTLGYRHAAVGIGRKKVGVAFARGYQEEVGEEEEEEPEQEDEAALEISAGRTTKIGEQAYAVSSNVVKHLSLRSMDTFRPLCGKWHDFLGLRSYGPKRMKTNEAEPSPKRRKTVVQTTSPPALATPPITPLQAQVEWSASSEKTPPTDHPSPSPTSSPLRPSPTDRDVPGEDELQLAMCRALGKDRVEYRSEEQADALRAVVRKETPLVVVLPTGGGKSLLFMAPACMGRQSGMTIVVVPFRQLIHSFIDKAKKCGIECEEWGPRTTDPVRLMVVSADKVGHPHFLGFGAMMRSKGVLKRVFVDECHLAFTAHKWRPALAEMQKVRCLGVPTTFLTATLPPVASFDFEDSMGLLYAHYIRAATNKRRTQYFVRQCKPGKLTEEVVDACRRRVRHFRKQEKGVVYCRSKKDAENLAALLECGFVHAEADDNEGTIDAWLDKGGMITATSALGTGVDYPGIVFVVHAGMPYGLIDYAQESGRADRDGKGACSVIMLEEGYLDRLERGNAMKSRDEEAMVEYLCAEGCRRRVLSRYMDGKEVCCEDEDMAGCDRCGEGEVDVQRSERVRAEDRGAIERVMDDLTDGCVACWLADAEARWTGGEEEGIDWRHWRQECPLAMEQEEEWDRFRQTVSFDLDSHSCYKCGFSQKLCRTGKSDEQKCQWPGVVSGVLLAALKTPTGRGIIRRSGFKGAMDAHGVSYRKWVRMAHRLRIWGEIMSNGMAIVLEYILWVESLG